MNNEPTSGRPCERTFVVEDISIRSGGDGRTVVAYAAVFNTPAEISDQDGHYLESIAPGAFDKTIGERAGQIGVFYNHGKTLFGTPSERASMPLGNPEEIRADDRGLLTITRYNRTPLADEVLEAIRNGDITGQSFSGRFVPGKSQRSRGRDGTIDTIVRTEISLREYGPTPMPSYKEAAIVGVRAEELAAVIEGLDDDQRNELIAILSTSRTVGEPPPDTEAAPGTSVPNDKPETHLSGPAPTERRLYVARFRKAS
jgi:HK97 family phage prohead protease